MKDLANLFEGFVIRVLWMLHASRLRKTPDLCPPYCQEGHTYKWPCRQRITKDTFLRREHDYYDDVALVEATTDLCGAKKAGGYGSLAKICTFKKNHEKQGKPHSWVVE